MIQFLPCRFSSGDLTSELGEDELASDPGVVGPSGNRPPPLQTQPVGSGPPNIPPPIGELIKVPKFPKKLIKNNSQLQAQQVQHPPDPNYR